MVALGGSVLGLGGLGGVVSVGACSTSSSDGDASPTLTSDAQAQADHREGSVLPAIDAAVPSTDAASTVDASKACPDVFGQYEVSSVTGGCGDLNPAATQCLLGASAICAARFTTKPADASTGGGVSGPIQVLADGTFSGASLSLGAQARQGCTGTFAASSSTITFSCGAGSDLCTVSLQRTQATCN